MNAMHEDTMSLLRRKIADRHSEEAKAKAERLAIAPIAVPKVTIEPSENAVFSYERHRQLMERFAATHHNYLVAMSEMSHAYDDMINEGVKPRI